MGYAEKTRISLIDEGIRAVLDARNERLQKKIRDAEVEKVPYMIVVGEREASEDSLSVRSKSEGEMGQMKAEDFIQMIKKEIKEKVK